MPNIIILETDGMGFCQNCKTAIPTTEIATHNCLGEKTITEISTIEICRPKLPEWISLCWFPGGIDDPQWKGFSWNTFEEARDYAQKFNFSYVLHLGNKKNEESDDRKT